MIERNRSRLKKNSNHRPPDSANHGVPTASAAIPKPMCGARNTSHASTTASCSGERESKQSSGRERCANNVGDLAFGEGGHRAAVTRRVCRQTRSGSPGKASMSASRIRRREPGRRIQHARHRAGDITAIRPASDGLERESKRRCGRGSRGLGICKLELVIGNVAGRGRSDDRPALGSRPVSGRWSGSSRAAPGTARAGPVGRADGRRAPNPSGAGARPAGRRVRARLEQRMVDREASETNGQNPASSTALAAFNTTEISRSGWARWWPRQ